MIFETYSTDVYPRGEEVEGWVHIARLAGFNVRAEIAKGQRLRASGEVRRLRGLTAACWSNNVALQTSWSHQEIGSDSVLVFFSQGAGVAVKRRGGDEVIAKNGEAIVMRPEDAAAVAYFGGDVAKLRLSREALRVFRDDGLLTKKLEVGTALNLLNAETLNGLGARKNRYFLRALKEQGVEIFTGAKSFILDARRRGVRTAIVSSSQNCAEILEIANLTRLFDVRVDGMDRRQFSLAGKPAPDMYCEAARRLDTSPARAVVYEDALVGVEAGRAGGFGLVVGVGQDAHAAGLLEHGADIVVADLNKLSLENYARDYRHE
jgi:HAD superfamily hydrolase (TIGR01509 family)